MRMRRLELAVLALTLAFAFFMGGFFAGRSAGSVSIAANAAQPGDLTVAQVSVSQPTSAVSPGASPSASANQGSADAAGTAAPQQPPAGTGTPRESDGKININTASVGELTDLPGIGNTLASRIVEYRLQYGGFAKIEDIRSVSGIGEKRFEAIMDLITVG